MTIPHGVRRILAAYAKGGLDCLFQGLLSERQWDTAMKNQNTTTRQFGSSNRESHDASAFYNRRMFGAGLLPLFQSVEELKPDEPGQTTRHVPSRPLETWVNRIYCHTAEAMDHIPDGSVALAFTSPPYNAGKTFDDDLDLINYLSLIQNVAREVYRTLVPGGRYVVNIANLGRKPYIPMHAYFYACHMNVGFLPAGEIIWQKGKGMSGNCAWGSWMSAKSPRLRDLHEYLLVFVKQDFSRPDKGISTITDQEFMSSTLSIWEVLPESAKKVGHPAPFPIELAERVIKLFSYRDDVVLDPFCGSGTTCVAAHRLNRYYVGYDISPEYCTLARQRIASL